MRRRVGRPGSRRSMACERTRIADEPYASRQTPAVADRHPSEDISELLPDMRPFAPWRDPYCYLQRRPVSEQTLDVPPIEVPDGPPRERPTTSRAQLRELA